MPQHQFSFDQFSTILTEIAEDAGSQTVVDGLAANGEAYSLKADIDAKTLDSLDVVEFVMALEERLSLRFGYGKDGLKIEDEWVAGTKNVGDLYGVICEKFDAGPSEAPSESAAA